MTSHGGRPSQGSVQSTAQRYGSTTAASSRASGTGVYATRSAAPPAAVPRSEASRSSAPPPPAHSFSGGGGSASARSGAARQGWLLKKNQGMSPNRVRWVRLSGDGFFRYYDSQKLDGARELPLSGAQVALSHDHSSFTLTGRFPDGRQTYTFCADESQPIARPTLRQWVDWVEEEIRCATTVPRPASSRVPNSGRSARTSSVIVNHQAFAGLLESYRKCVTGGMHDEVDAADLAGVARYVREVADPSQLALSKLHEYDQGGGADVEKELEQIWNTFDADRDGQLSEREITALVHSYFGQLQKVWRSLLEETVRRIFRLFCVDQSEGDRAAQSFLRHLTDKAAQHVDEFFRQMGSRVPEVARDMLHKMDTNRDGKVEKHEFMNNFLEVAELRDMGTATVSTISDEVVSAIQKRIYGGSDALAKHQPGVCGLSNIGNTCYMNSALQCLSMTTRFRQFFISGEYRAHINKENRLGTGGRLADKFGELLNQLWSGQSQSVKPRDFKSTLGSCNEQFRGWAQEDSQELLNYLLDRLHEDLNKVTVKEYVEIKDRPGASDDSVAEEYWSNHIRRNRSVVVSLFQGQIRSIVKCLRCGYEGKAFDPFMMLSLPVPERGGSCTLADCFQKFTAAEDIAGSGNEWYCPSCKTHVRSRKDITLWRLPHYLIVHLKRFKYNAYGTISSKIDAKVDFPEQFEPRPWLAPGRTVAQALSGGRAGTPSDPSLTPCAFSPRGQVTLPGAAPSRRAQSPVRVRSSGLDADLPRVAASDMAGVGSPREKELQGVYHLFGVINHYGSISGGHYTAYAKVGEQQWYCFDDSYVSPLAESPSAKARASGYVLFYKIR